MEFRKLPPSLDEYSVQVISIVADVINNCNHACTYCHPMENGSWGGDMLSAGQIGDVLRASDEAGALEVSPHGRRDHHASGVRRHHGSDPGS